VARDLFEAEPALLRPGQRVLADKGYRSKEFESFLAGHGVELVRPAHKNDRGRVTSPLLKPLRQLIESVNATLKTQLDLERHGGRTPGGVMTRVLQRLLALTAAIWHNAQSGKRPLRSLVAFDHG
jgi:Transposase DDE domain